MQTGKLLIIDDEPEVLNTLKRVLRTDYEVHIAESPTQAFSILREADIQVVLCDQRMPEMQGTDFLKEIKETYPDITRILITGYSSLYDVVLATNESNVFKYLTKPWDVIDLRNGLREAFEKNQLIRENRKMMNDIKQINKFLEEKITERTNELELLNQQLIEMNDKLKILALKDTLTGLNNRTTLEAKFNEEKLRAARTKSPLSLMVIDINDFKKINDTLGHVEGDMMLKTFAALTKKFTREGVDFVFRIGGDEFLIIMTDCDEKAALEVGQRLNNEFRKYTDIATLAYGAVQLDNNSESDLNYYLKAADDRMFEHKKKTKFMI